MAIYMGFWDCAQCQQKRIAGTELRCTGCKTPRDPKVKFYTAADAPEVTDAKQLALAKSGADWACGYCGKDNHAGASKCEQCMAERDTAKAREQKVIPTSSAPARRSGGSGAKVAVIVLALLGLAGFGIWWHWFRTTSHGVRLDRVTWVKTLTIEQRTIDRREAWSSEVPSGARELGRTMRTRTRKVQDGTTKVKVGQRDLGNGTFEDVYQDQPRYVDRQYDEAWVTYEIERWTTRDVLRQASTDGSEPKAPGYTPTGTERLGKHTSVATLALSGGGDSYSYDVDLASAADPASVVRSYKVGDRFVAHVNGAGSVRSLDRQ